ncbi:MAG: hypothetical protein ABMB14_32155 [Myxococcota bacterium]
MVSVLATVVVLAFGWILTAISARTLPAAEARWVTASFVMHVIASFMTVIVSNVVYHGMVDFAGFQRAGELIASAIRQDPWQVLPRAIALFFHSDTVINVPLNFEAKGGGSTVSMWIIATFGNLVFAGSFQATATACALFSFAGKVAAYRTLRQYFAPHVRPWVGASMLLVPSVVYWTSGLIKEGIAVGGLGFALSGAHAFLFERRPPSAVIAVAGAVLVGLIKPYVLMPLGIGFGVLMYVRAATAGGSSTFRVRPIYLVLSIAVALTGVLVVGRLFPLFAIENLGEAASKMQFYGRRAAGGSFYLLGDPSESSVLGQLRYAPIALFTAFFRPTLLEIRNPLLAINAVETTALLGMTVYLLVTQGWRWILRSILSNPGMAFCVAFAVPLALGVGLVSNNLGTLSRYRCPMVPYQVTVLAALYAGAHARAVVQRVSPVQSTRPARAPYRLPPAGERPRPDRAAGSGGAPSGGAPPWSSSS